MKRYLWNILIWLDQGVNVLLGWLLNWVFRTKTHRFGDPDETLSSVFGKNILAGECVGCKLVCRILNWFEPNHCILSIEQDEGLRLR